MPHGSGKNLEIPGKGAAIGLAAMLPFVPGMLGSRKKGGELRDIYSGVDPVPIHAGRWWEVGSTPFEGARIKEWRPHWSILHKSHAEEIRRREVETQPDSASRPGGNIVFPYPPPSGSTTAIQAYWR
jgi:hypothetical protein